MPGATRVRLVLAAFVLSTFVYVTTETLPIGVLPLIARDLDVSQTAVGLLVSGYALVVVVATIPLTRITRRVPRRVLLPVLLGVLVIASLAAAASTGYAMLLVARLVTALTQAVFWAIVIPTAAGLVASERRGRTISAVYGGGSLAVVVGVPLGTFVGQLATWRIGFVAIAVLAAVAMVVVAVLLRADGAGGSPLRGTEPDLRRYGVLVAVTTLSVTGAFTAFTFVSPFLTDVSGLAPESVGAVLLVRGIGGLLAVIAVGRAVDRHPRGTAIAVVGGLAVALLAQFLLGSVGWASATAVVVAGAAAGAYAALLGARVLVVAPGSTDLASAGTSTAFNVGIMAGAFTGGAALPLVGLAGLPLLGGLTAAVALVLVLVEPRRLTVGEVAPRA